MSKKERFWPRPRPSKRAKELARLYHSPLTIWPDGFPDPPLFDTSSKLPQLDLFTTPSRNSEQKEDADG